MKLNWNELTKINKKKGKENVLRFLINQIVNMKQWDIKEFEL